MCQVLRGKPGVIDHSVNLCIEGVEGTAERSGDGR